MGRRDGNELAGVFRTETARLLHALDDRGLVVLLDHIPDEEPVDRGVRGAAGDTAGFARQMQELAPQDVIGNGSAHDLYTVP